MESGQSEDEAATPPRRKKQKRTSNRNKQKYSALWESNELFRGWISQGKDKYQAHCKFCDCSLKSDVTCLKRHATSQKHVDYANAILTNNSMYKYTKQEPSSSERKVKTAELKLSAFFAEHDISFNVADHFADVIKEAFPDSPTAQAMTLKRTKLRAIIVNSIGESFEEELVETLRKNKFSIMVDESTDIGTVKVSCIVVRYFDEKTGKITSRFLDLSTIFDLADTDKAFEGATAENLFNSIKKSLDEHKIPPENVIGFCSDGCNTMMGCKNSVQTRLAKEYPNITIWKCICHSLHLCACEACKLLPSRCERIALGVYSHFKNSSKRIAQFKEFQTFADVELHRILHPSQTRWLSMQMVVHRILEQWPALQLYFNNAHLVDATKGAEEIYMAMNDPTVKIYFCFLDWFLPKITKLNEYFQSEKVVLPNVHSRMTEFLKEILMCYMKTTYVNQTSIAKIDPYNKNEFKPCASMYFGVKVMKELQKPEISGDKAFVESFHKRARSFLICVCNQVMKRYDFSNDLMSHLEVLDPEKALSVGVRDQYPSLLPLISKLPRIVSPDDDALIQKLDTDWRKLPLITDLPERFITEKLPADEFWWELKKLTTQAGNSVLEALPAVALQMLSLPHSNADCERLFSAVNNIKVKKRNKLITTTIKGCLLAKEAISRGSFGKSKENINCTNFIPTEAMFSRLTTSSLYKKNEKGKVAADERKVAEGKEKGAEDEVDEGDEEFSFE